LNSTGDLETVRALLGHEKIEGAASSKGGIAFAPEDAQPG
jgi:hypothetical protein